MILGHGRQHIVSQISELHQPRPEADRNHDLQRRLHLDRKHHEERQEEFPEDQDQAQAPPRAVLADEVPEGLLRHVGVPHHEVLGELVVGGKDGEGEKQNPDEIEIIFLQQPRQNPLPLQQNRNDIDRRQSDPRAAREKIDAVNGGEELVLDRLHPEHRRARQRGGIGHNAPAGMEPHPMRAERVAGDILAQRPVTQARGQQPPHREEQSGYHGKAGPGEHRPAGADEFIGGRQGQPVIDLGRQQQDGNEQEGQPREEQRGQVLAKAADAHRPARIGQMMDHHQEQRAQRQAQIKEEG